MIVATSGLISASILVLDAIDKLEVKTKKDIIQTGAVNFVKIEDVLEFAINCGWIQFSKHDRSYSLSNTGKSITNKLVGGDITPVIWRQMLFSYATHCKPNWTKRVPAGRKEASIFMTKDERRCFVEAELLLDELSDDSLVWWDLLSTHIRAQPNEDDLITGRKGELLTLLYEENRVGKKPKYVAFDTNVSGYDIDSITCKDDSTPIHIEVKSTMDSIDYGSLYITENEWFNASTVENYIFYVWSFHKGKQLLANVSPEKMLSHIPSNNGCGQWTDVKVPLSAFADLFQDISSLDNNEQFSKYKSMIENGETTFEIEY